MVQYHITRTKRANGSYDNWHKFTPLALFETENKMDCFKCKHRLPVPGSCHSTCKHPKVVNDDPFANLLGTLASVGRTSPIISPAIANLGIMLNPHGVKNGWCNFPFDFDPIWVDACKGYEEINTEEYPILD